MSQTDRVHRGDHEPDDWMSKVLSALLRGVVLFIRQSTPGQRFNRGSQLYQEQQLNFLRHWRIDLGKVTHLVATGDKAESASSAGPHFRELLTRIREGRCGVVVLSQTDRLAREDHVSELYEELAKRRGLLLINGNFYDPADEQQRLMLDLQSAMAKFENRMRRFRMVASKLALAHDLAFPINLPTGLVWADPLDPEYQHRLRMAGMGDILGQLDKHREGWQPENRRRHFILPYPDADVIKSVHLRMQYLRDGGTFRAVIRGICSDSSWPVPGRIPVSRGYVFSRLVGAEGDESLRPYASDVQWVPVAGPADHQDFSIDRTRLAAWFRSGPLYGRYQLASSAILNSEKAAALLGGSVDERNAFPSFFTDADCEEVERLLTMASKPARAPGALQRPRVHLLDGFRCDALMPDGSRCNHMLRGRYGSDRSDRFAYRSSACIDADHVTSLPREVDDVVLDMVVQRFSSASLSAALDRLERNDAVGGADLRRAVSLVDRAKKDIAYAEHQARKAFDRNDREDEAEWDDRRQAARRELRKREQELERMTMEQKEHAALSASEREELLALTADLHGLFARARQHEHLGRRLMRSFVREARARRLGKCVHLITATFADGGTEQRVFFNQVGVASQPERALAWSYLAPFLDPTIRETHSDEAHRAATEAARLLATLRPVSDNSKVRPADWTADRAWATAYAYEYIDRSATEESAENANEAGAHDHGMRESANSGRPLNVQPGRTAAGASAVHELTASVAEFARLLNISSEDLMRRVVLGRCGTVVPRQGGPWTELTLRVDRTRLLRNFPRFAATEVEIAEGWDIGDACPLEELMGEYDWRRAHAMSVAREAQRRFGFRPVKDDAGYWYVNRRAITDALELMPTLRLSRRPRGYRRTWSVKKDADHAARSEGRVRATPSRSE
jgi:DNA invertase Pin-like site-specific DNA recombinase